MSTDFPCVSIFSKSSSNILKTNITIWKQISVLNQKILLCYLYLKLVCYVWDKTECLLNHRNVGRKGSQKEKYKRIFEKPRRGAVYLLNFNYCQCDFAFWKQPGHKFKLYFILLGIFILLKSPESETRISLLLWSSRVLHMCSLEVPKIYTSLFTLGLS